MEKKLELIAYIESGNKQIDASHHFGYPSSTVKAIWQVREKVKAYSANGHDMTKKKANFSPHQPLDEPLLEWYYKMLDMNVPVTGPLIQNEAIKIAEKLGLKDFGASNGWLYRFKTRHGIFTKTKT